MYVDHAWPALSGAVTSPAQDPWQGLVDGATEAARDLPVGALALARSWGPRLPLPGRSQTARLWQALAAVAAVDLSVARAFEPHLDARAILAEAGRPAPPNRTWGVFAAEGAETRLVATERPGRVWTLSGTKPWCSLAGYLTHALVTAWVGPDERGLFEVNLGDRGVEVVPGTWHARGLTSITSGPVHMRDVPANPVGGPGWYLRRDGFAWGGLGVAAVWYGGAVGVARRLAEATTARTPDQLALTHLGAVDARLHAVRTALSEAAADVDAGRATGRDGQLLALRVRQIVADAAEAVLVEAGHAMGPAPLASEPAYAARVADLTLYLRQHHAERDAAALGELLLDQATDGRS